MEINSETLNVEVKSDYLVVETDFFKAVYRWEALITKANVGGHGYSCDDVAYGLTVRNVGEEYTVGTLEMRYQEVDVYCPISVNAGVIIISKIRVMPDIGWLEVISADGRRETINLNQLAQMVSRNNPLPKGVVTH
jgi:hypothetical protein